MRNYWAKTANWTLFLKQLGPYIIGTVNIKPRKYRITLKYVLRRHRKIQAYFENDIHIDYMKKKFNVLVMRFLARGIRLSMPIYSYVKCCTSNEYVMRIFNDRHGF